MRKMPLSFIVVLLLIFPFSQAITSYNQTGTENQFFSTGDGELNAGTSPVTTSKSFTDLRNIPLVADLDGDGINEIIIIDSSDVTIRKADTDLSAINALTLEAGTYSNPILIDIDNDGFTEIILANEASGNGNISILQYNGTSFIRETLLKVEIPTIADGTIEIMINCNDGQAQTESISCIYALAVSPEGAGTRNFSVASFNASTVVQPTTLVSTVDTNEDYCFPLIPYISYSDFDIADSRKEFIFTATEFKRTANEKLNIFYIDVAEDLTRTIDQTTTFSSGFLLPLVIFNPVTTALDCSDNIGKFYSSPLVFDLDGNSGNGKETAVAISEDFDEFKIITFKANGNTLDRHPKFFDVDGEILSGVMLANVYGDNGKIDFCVLGHDSDEQEIDLVCASENTQGIDLPFNLFNSETVEFKFSTDSRFNITNAFNRQNIISHMGQHQGTIVNIGETGFTNTNELITSYGVFQLSDTTFNGSLFVKSLDLIFTNPVGDSACIPVDAQKSGAEDLICITSGSLFYVDDNLQNEPAFISENPEFNPCIDAGIVKVNSTMQIKVVVEDGNSDIIGKDLVGSNVTIYAGDSNEISSSFTGVTSGESRFHLFELNKTGNVDVEIRAFDNIASPTVQTVTTSFTVGINGVEFGDCQSELDIVLPEEEVVVIITEGTLTEDASDNAITTGILTVIDLTGLAGTTFWLLLMLAFSIAIFFQSASLGWSGNSSLGAIAIINVLFIVIGVRVGVISTGLVVILVVLGVVILGVFLGKFLTGAGAEG